MRLAALAAAGSMGLLLTAFVLSGCTLDAGSGQTPEQARDAFRAVLDSTQRELGGAWQVNDDPTPRGCTIPLWVEGERYPGLRLGPVPEAPTESLRIVAEHWTSLGYTVEQNHVGDVTELSAGGTRFDSLIFRVSDSGMTLQGESECRPSS